MDNRRGLTGAIVLFAMGAMVALPAFAAVPKISGSYVVSYNETCQAYNFTNPGGFNGEVTRLVYSGTFNTSNHTVSLSGRRFDGPMLSFLTNGAQFTSSAAALSGNYSNSPTTLTLPGQTLSIEYGDVVNGVVQSAVFAGIPPDHGSTCAVDGTLIRSGK